MEDETGSGNILLTGLPASQVLGISSFSGGAALTSLKVIVPGDYYCNGAVGMAYAAQDRSSGY